MQTLSPCPKDDPVIEAATRMFLRDGWIDARALAKETGIGRATLYRRYVDRDRILGEVIWAIREAGWPKLRARIDATGAELIAELVRRGLHSMAALPAFQHFLKEHTDVALRVMTSRHGIIHKRLVASFTQLIADEIGEPTGIETEVLAYAVVRIGESFFYRGLMAGDPHDLDAAAAIIRRLLS